MDLNVNASPITQAAATTAVGGPGVLGSGGDAIAVTNQDADSTNVQFGDHDYFPWGGPLLRPRPQRECQPDPSGSGNHGRSAAPAFSATAATPLPSPTRTPTSSTSRANKPYLGSAIGPQPVALFLFDTAASHPNPASISDCRADAWNAALRLGAEGIPIGNACEARHSAWRRLQP